MVWATYIKCYKHSYNYSLVLGRVLTICTYFNYFLSLICLWSWALSYKNPRESINILWSARKVGLNRSEMTAKLVCTLETAMYRSMQEKQYSAVASNAKVLMKLINLKAKTR